MIANPALLVLCFQKFNSVKSSYGVDFINVLGAAFASKDPESVKKTVMLSVFFTLSGCAHVKAAHRTLMKLRHGDLEND